MCIAPIVDGRENRGHALLWISLGCRGICGNGTRSREWRDAWMN